jgi:hypothetical protein
MARYIWLMSVILATQEAEIRRTGVRSQPRANSPMTLSQKKPVIKGVLEAQVVEHLSS